MTRTDTTQRSAQATQPEDDFVALFAQVFGFEKTQLLAPEYPVVDIYGATRYIDFALKSAGRMIAFEVDGPTHYATPDFDLKKFEDDLLRQNSLMHQGWQVFRWSDRELAKDPDRVKEQTLKLLDGSLPVLARMETLRRAALHLADSRSARSTLSRALALRVLDAEADGKPAALAWFDAGYAAGCFEQLRGDESPRGYRWVRRANELAGGDARMEYALCLLTLMDGPDRFRVHLEKVEAGAAGDPLLAKNLAELKQLAPAVLRYFEEREKRKE